MARPLLRDPAPGLPGRAVGPEGTLSLEGDPYRRFYDAVAARQVAEWLPTAPALVLDLSGSDRFARQVVTAGLDVLRVVGPADQGSGEVLTGSAGTARPGRTRSVVADASHLGWLADGSVDAVLAESRCLSLSLAAEITVAHLGRVLRPGGSLLLCVDSLVLGMSRLAEQGRWAELADVPSADVVLIPSPDGTITRCFWPQQLHDVLSDAGLEVDWVRPRSVLSPASVTRALETDPTGLRPLVETELALARARQGESTGMHLVASARRPR